MKGNSKSNQAAVKEKPHLDPKDRDPGPHEGFGGCHEATG